MRPHATDVLAAGQDSSRLSPIGEGQLRGEAAYSQSRPSADMANIRWRASQSCTFRRSATVEQPCRRRSKSDPPGGQFSVGVNTFLEPLLLYPLVLNHRSVWKRHQTIGSPANRFTDEAAAVHPLKVDSRHSTVKRHLCAKSVRDWRHRASARIKKSLSDGNVQLHRCRPSGFRARAPVWGRVFSGSAPSIGELAALHEYVSSYFVRARPSGILVYIARCIRWKRFSFSSVTRRSQRVLPIGEKSHRAERSQCAKYQKCAA